MDSLFTFMNSMKANADSYNNKLSVGLNVGSKPSRQDLIEAFNQTRERTIHMMASMGSDCFSMPSKGRRRIHQNKKSNQKQLCPMFIDEFKKCDIYSGKQLTARIVVKPFKMNAIHMIIEDDFESVIQLFIYDKANIHKYKMGTKICVYEPYYKSCDDGSYQIRVDSAAKVKILSKNVPIGIKEKSPLNWKELANTLFANKNYHAAHQCYTQGISYFNDNDHVVTALLNNRSLCYTKQNKYKQSLINIMASKYINPNSFKVWQREIKCLNKLHQHKAALFVWKQALKRFEKDKVILLQLEKALNIKINADCTNSESKVIVIDTEWDVLGVIIEDMQGYDYDRNNIAEEQSKFKPLEWKEMGNKAFEEGKYDDAIQYYTYGLVNNYTILAILFGNRAASSIYLRKYKDAFIESTLSIIINPQNVKSWIRRCVTAFKLGLNDIANIINEKYSSDNRALFAKTFKSAHFIPDDNDRKQNALNTDILYDNNSKVSKEDTINILKHRNTWNSQPMQRVHRVLQLYDNWINSNEKCSFSFSNFLENNLNYSHQDILNDFHQILPRIIDNDNNNKHLHICKKENCDYVKRNNRDRHVMRKQNNRRKMYFGYNDSVNCALFQTLDTIHSVVHHTDIHRNRLTDKFVADFEIDSDFNNPNDEIKHNDNYSNFGFGEPFVYYKELRASGIHIQPYYNTLEEEMLNNPHYQITQYQYDDFYNKASNLLKTDLFTKHIKSNFGGDGERLGITKGSNMTMNHIISLLIYCNDTEAQRVFKQHCRKLKVYESIDSIKNRHIYIGNWMRYLWDSTRLYGTLMNANEVVYTGMKGQLLFSSFSNFYYAPLSTSSSIIVARGFATDDGIVVKLKTHEQHMVRYFDMMPLSDFVHEREKFFLSAKLTIVDIIMDATSYLIQVSAVRLFEKIISGQLFYNKCNPELITDEVQLQLIEFINNYLKHKHFGENSNLNYIQKMFNNMISNYLKPQNYNVDKLGRMDNDTFHIFIDAEELEKLNSKLSTYFLIQERMSKKRQYGVLLNYLDKINKDYINFCCKHIILTLDHKGIKELKNDRKLGLMRYCYGTEPITVYYEDRDGQYQPFTFTLRFCKTEYENGDRYEIFLNDVTQCDHNFWITFDFHCNKIKYQHYGVAFAHLEAEEFSFVGFLCSKLDSIYDELQFVLNMRILSMYNDNRWFSY